MTFYNIEHYGAQPNSTESSTEAIANAIQAASEAGGGTVYVPSGTYHTGAIFMKSNIELQLSPGAVLQFSSDPNDYPVMESRWEGVKQKVHASCIFGMNLQNVSVTGAGKLDGGAHRGGIKNVIPQSLYYFLARSLSASITAAESHLEI